MQVSVIIVNYKVPYHLCLCLGSLNLALKNLKSEIIVVDNDSKDNTSTLVKTYFPNVDYIQSPSNLGFSKANNLAIKKAKGEYIFLINPDTVIGNNTIEDAIKKHKQLKKCGILGVRLLDGKGQFLPESKINQLTLKSATLKLMGFSKSYYNLNLNQKEEGYTATLVGAFMCFKASDYQKIDGLDENYFMYGEDIDLSYQFIKAGLKNYYFGKTAILHFKGESTLKDKVYFQRFFDSVKLYFKKHYTNSKIMIGIASIFFVIAKRFKKKQISKPVKNRNNIQNIYGIGISDDTIDIIKKHFKKPVHDLSFEKANKTAFSNSLIIFNTDEGNYTEIIEIMSNNNQSNNIFRIKVPQQNIFIGSDSSTSQGEVIRL